MPRVNIPVLNVDADGVAPGNTAANATDFNMFDAGSNVVLLARNSGASARTVTITTPATVSGLAVADIGPVSIPAGEERIFGPFPANIWAQPSGADTGKVYVDANHAEVLLSPLRVP